MPVGDIMPTDADETKIKQHGCENVDNYVYVELILN